ncbi:MAG: hypothetical protein IPM92_00030 [Saprospiraceae bacterium]|nr:hypothetical protein [Saprospiraceae bacterium]
MKNIDQGFLDSLKTVFTSKAMGILYEASIGKEKNLTSLIEETSDEFMKAALEIQLEQVKENKEIIRQILESLNSGECLSRETIFWNTHHRTVIFKLKVNSEAYKMLGGYVVGWPQYEEAEQLEIIENTQAKRESYGRIKIKPTKLDEFTEEQQTYLLQTGIQSCDILEY